MRSRIILEDQIHYLQRKIKERENLLNQLSPIENDIAFIASCIEEQIKLASFEDDIKGDK